MKHCQFLAVLLAVFLFVPNDLQAGSLQDRIQNILNAAGLSSREGLVSIQIVTLPEGNVLFEQNPDLTLSPASNVKLVTAGAALKELGPDFTFKTEFYSEGLIKEGKIRNLWIKGYGDPLFITEELDSVTNTFHAAGLKEIEGQVFVDDTYFDRYNLTTYLSDANEKVYSIITGPLSFNFNSIEIKAHPARRLGDQPIIAIEPPTSYVKILNQAKTGRTGIGLEAQLKENNGNEITIVGNIPRTIREYSFRKGILDPATYTGTVIMEALEKTGVTIQGGLKREAVPSQALLIFSHSSPPLKEILKGLGKFSNNFIAEQLVKTMGAVRTGPPGSTSKGLRLMKGYLVSLGIPESSFVLDNGSGLSRLTRISSSQVIRVLKDLYNSSSRDDWISCLSVVGRDGTMRHKMRHSPLVGKVFAKTGTLNGVNALSGYLMDERQPIAFSFLLNDINLSQGKITRVEENILRTILTSLKKRRGT